LKKKLWFTLALVVVLVISVGACSRLKKASDIATKPGETPTTPTTPTTPDVGSVTKTKVGDTYTYSGNLRGINDSNKFDLFLNSKSVDVVFTFPAGAGYSCKVLGMSGDELGDYELDKGDTITLSGGGKFSLIVYSGGGSGAWTATYTDK